MNNETTNETWVKKTFQKGSGCYTCHDCGKLTRETGDGESNCELCRNCFWIAQWENGCVDNVPNSEDGKQARSHYKFYAGKDFDESEWACTRSWYVKGMSNEEIIERFTKEEG